MFHTKVPPIENKKKQQLRLWGSIQHELGEPAEPKYFTSFQQAQSFWLWQTVQKENTACCGEKKVETSSPFGCCRMTSSINANCEKWMSSITLQSSWTAESQEIEQLHCFFSQLENDQTNQRPLRWKRQWLWAGFKWRASSSKCCCQIILLKRMKLDWHWLSLIVTDRMFVQSTSIHETFRLGCQVIPSSGSKQMTSHTVSFNLN